MQMPVSAGAEDPSCGHGGIFVEACLWKHRLASFLCSCGQWEEQKVVLQKADAGSWQGVGRIKAIPAHCKRRRGNAPVAAATLPEKRLQSTAHHVLVFHHDQGSWQAPKCRRAGAEQDVYKDMMAGLVNCFGNDSKAHSHVKRDPEAHRQSPRRTVLTATCM